MGVRNYPDIPVLSGDGRYLAFADQSPMGGINYSVLLRKTDGSPPVRLGEGYPLALSADDDLVLATVFTTPPSLMLYPTGPGVARRIDSGRFQTSSFAAGDVRVTGRDTVAFFCGAEPGQPARCFVHSLPRGSITKVTPPGITKGWISPDGSRVLAAVGDSFSVYPVGGGVPRPARGIRPGDVPIRWSPDGRDVWVWTDPNSVTSMHVDRVDPATGTRSPLLSVVPGELGGVRAFGKLTLADDPHVYAYVEYLYTSRLYTVEGLR